jgi:hypothetical protein
MGSVQRRCTWAESVSMHDLPKPFAVLLENKGD